MHFYNKKKTGGVRKRAIQTNFLPEGFFPDRTRVGVPLVIDLIFVITNESGSLPISRTCHIYICTFLPSCSRSYFSVKFKPWDDVCVQISSHTSGPYNIKEESLKETIEV